MSTSFVVLCVSDDQAALKVRSLALSSAGYQVFTAGNIEDALRLFRLNPVDLVVVEPPSCKVSEVVGEMKQIRPHVPIFLLPKDISSEAFLDAVDAIVILSHASAAEGDRQ
jgi:DNA-binding NtrC family response regulator